MESNTGTPLRAHGLRPLGLPRPLRVDVDEHGMPIRIDLGLAVGPRAQRIRNSSAQRTPNSGAKRIPGSSGAKRQVRDQWQDARWTAVLDVLEVWRVAEEWWRDRPIRRTYFRLVVQDGRTLTIFRDDLTPLPTATTDGAWFEQRY